MKNYQLSDTYKILFNTIIGELLSNICNSNINYCVRDEEVPIDIGKRFEEYKLRASKNMTGSRLDRHKLASCICGAIIETKPLVGYKGAVIVKNANEIFALHVGLNVLKFYMMYDLLYSSGTLVENANNVKEYLKECFNVQFPSLEDNVCDIQEYELNLYNALYWTHQKCDIINIECFQYDIWAYSKIFYHLELYNRDFLKKAYEEYIENRKEIQQESKK